MEHYERLNIYAAPQRGAIAKSSHSQQRPAMARIQPQVLTAAALRSTAELSG